MNEIIGIEFNFTPSTTSSLLATVESCDSLTNAIWNGRAVFHSDPVFSCSFTANNTFFSVTQVASLSSFIENAAGIAVENHVYKSETSELRNGKSEIIKYGLESRKIFTDSIENYHSTEGIGSIPYVGSVNDFYPPFLSKLRQEPFAISVAYDELFNAWMLKISKVIFILDEGSRGILEKQGIGVFKNHVINVILKFYKNYRYRYY